MMSILLESLVLVLFRAALFLSCRSFVLNRLYSDLQNISTPSDEHDDVELDVLPTHAKSNSGRATDTGYSQSTTMHSKISRTVFAGCFSESCILFVLLMCQGLGLFDPTGVPSERDIEQTERALERVKDDLTTRKHQLEAKRNATSSSNGGAPTSAGASWYSRIVPNLRGNDDEAEVAGLQMLYEQMDHNLSDLKRRKQDELFQRTIWGRMYGVVRLCMAIYWIARIIWVHPLFHSPISSYTALQTIVKVLIYQNFFASSLSPSTNYPDLISKLLADLLSFIHRRHFGGHNHDLLSGSDNGQTPADLGETQEKIKVIARQISLLFVGLVVIISIRMVLRGVSRILSRMTKLKLRRNLGASVMLVLLAQLMGIYLLSTIVQLRASFPPPAVSSSSITELAFESDIATEQSTNLFTTIPPFEVFGSLFDGAFLLAATLSILVRWMGNKIGAEWDP
ncbi:hypothetical protein HHX47_DHR9000511 [Lentinula edodes]|nr:hypothetical protein HHX47_DHR9000511 [Lentinula edodes]